MKLAPMDYVLVIQFDEELISHDEMILLEDALIAALADTADVDGHDRGAGEINYFIVTDHPRQTFEMCVDVLRSSTSADCRAAYRSLEGQEYTILWPPDLTEFEVT